RPRGDVPHADRVIRMTRDETAAVGAEREVMGVAANEGECLNMQPGLCVPELDHSGFGAPDKSADSHPLPIGAEGDRRVEYGAVRHVEDAARRAIADVDGLTKIDGRQVAAIGAERDRENSSVIAVNRDVLEMTPLEITPFPSAQSDGAVVKQLVSP